MKNQKHVKLTSMYILLFPKNYYWLSDCMNLLQTTKRAELRSRINAKKNVCVCGNDHTLFAYNLEVFFTLRNGGEIPLLEDYWIFPIEF